MAVMLDDKSEPGELYISENLEIYRVQGWFSQPSITIESVQNGHKVGGAVGCLNLEPFTRLELMQHSELCKVVKQAALQALHDNRVRTEMVETISSLRLQIIDLKDKIAELKLFGKEGAPR